MHIITVGLHYKNTPVEWREKFTFSDHDLPEALVQLRHTKSILECVIISTCNRTEIFAVVEQLHTGRHFVQKFLAQWFDVEREEFSRFVDIKENDTAIRHMFELAVGLDSMVLGETQILGQLKHSFLSAQKYKTTGTIFNTLIKQVITLAKMAHAETGIGEHAVSVSYAAVELAKKIYGELNEKTVLIIGAGEMSELTAKHLRDQGVSDVYVVNRTFDHAHSLAQKISGTAHHFDQLEECLASADIVISSTGAKQYVLTRDMVERVMPRRRSAHPLFLIDIAVPRDLDAAIHDVENAFLYDIDDLNGIVQENLAERQKEAEKITLFIDKEMDDFNHWLATLGVVPLINAMRQKALNIQEQTMQSIENKLDLTERDRTVLKKHTKSIINQMMRDPILRIKEMAGERNADQALEMFTNIFALEEELLKQENIEEAKQLAKTLDKQRQEQKLGSYHFAKKLPAQL